MVVIMLGKKPKEIPYNYNVVGYGNTAADALAQAEAKLPFPINDPIKYKRFKPGEPVQAEGGLWKITFMYDLPTDTKIQAKEAQQVQRKSSSAGPTDVFAVTRDLDDIL